MVFRLGSAELSAFNASVQARYDRELAQKLINYRPDLLGDMSEDDLTIRIGKTRSACVNMGVRSPRLRTRWIMIDALLFRDFWLDDQLSALLHSPSGTQDQKFRDVCAAILCAARSQGFEGDIWWINRA